jgi:hypothetical protein
VCSPTSIGRAKKKQDEISISHAAQSAGLLKKMRVEENLHLEVEKAEVERAGR